MPPDVGEFFRDRAFPLATIATPNAFELEWLTGERVTNLQAAQRAIAALRARGPRVVAATSLQLDDTPADALDILAGDGTGPLAGAHAAVADFCQRIRAMCSRRSSFIIGSRRASTREALSSATSAVYAVVKATLDSGSRELSLIAAQDEFTRPSQLFTAETV